MSPVRNVAPDEAARLIDDGAFVIDVREPNEWNAGHLEASNLIPLADVPDHLDELPKDRLIVCVCRSGGRSHRAAVFLAESGFDVVNLEGGMTEWHAQDRPMVADGSEPRVE